MLLGSARLRRLVLCALGATWLFVGDARAILHEDGYLAGECAWASVVNVGQNCTGTLIDPEHVLLAAHCDGASSANFGETDLDHSGEVEVEFESCTVHEDWTGETDLCCGPDIMVCTLHMETPAPDVPIIPQMVPAGPARDWLRDEVYAVKGDCNREADTNPHVTIVGTGCNDLVGQECQEQGDKYEIDEDPTLCYQYAEDGTNTKLRMDSDGETKHGDSGGPTFVRFRDGSWRQIGVHHASVPGFDSIAERTRPRSRIWGP